MSGPGRPWDRVEAWEGRWWAASDSRVVSALHLGGVAVIRRVVPGRERAHRTARRYRRVLHRGDTVECPLCGSTFRHFMARPSRENAICWTCGSAERHRTLWLLLTRRRPELLDGVADLLHFAPEATLERAFRAKVPNGYVTCDITEGVGDLTIDVRAIDLPDASFDAIICSHVLEHVDDDRRAMRELHRVVRPGGWVIVSAPIDRKRAATVEDPSIVTPEERLRHFGQENHVRVYGLDIFDRLADAGFEVEDQAAEKWADQATIAHYRLGRDLLLCRRP